MAAEYCLKQSKFERVYKIFEAMHSMNIPVRPHYFLPEFIWEARQNGFDGSVKVLRKMLAFGIQPDWEMLLNWIIPILYDLERDLFEVIKTVKDVTGLSYSSGNILSAGLTFAVQENKLKECTALGMYLILIQNKRQCQKQTIIIYKIKSALFPFSSKNSSEVITSRGHYGQFTWIYL